MKQMSIAQLTHMLETQINEKMDEFHKIGTEAKRVRTELDALYNKMLDIFIYIRPAENIVRLQNPGLNPLFDELAKLYESQKGS